VTSSDIEIALSHHLDWFQNVMVCNVHGCVEGISHECDLLVLRRSGWAIEVEIKVSKADIRADLKKKHAHESDFLKELWFAVPGELAENPHIPERAGIIGVYECKRFGKPGHGCKVVRKAQRNKDARKFSNKQTAQLRRACYYRMWHMKHQVHDLNREYKRLIDSSEV